MAHVKITTLGKEPVQGFKNYVYVARGFVGPLHFECARLYRYDPECTGAWCFSPASAKALTPDDRGSVVRTLNEMVERREQQEAKA